MNKNMLEKLSNYRVLYAEDEAGVRKNVAEMLKLLFKEVYVAADGKEAYKLFEEYLPDIVITDIQMPYLSGIDLAKKIRKRDENTQILIISAHTEIDYMLEAVELSLIRYIVKPITETKLFEALERFLEIQKSAGIIDLTKDWVYDSANKIIKNNSLEYELTKKESSLLELLLSKKSVLTYEEIEMELWPDEYMSLNALRLLMKNFRKKLPKDYLKNIQGVGYKL
jgi:DNA-binding response OmpR family regulator